MRSCTEWWQAILGVDDVVGRDPKKLENPDRKKIESWMVAWRVLKSLQTLLLVGSLGRSLCRDSRKDVEGSRCVQA